MDYVTTEFGKEFWKNFDKTIAYLALRLAGNVGHIEIFKVFKHQNWTAS